MHGFLTIVAFLSLQKLFANAEGDPMMVMLWRDTKSGVRVVDEPAPLHGSQEEKDQYLDRWNAKVEAKLAEFFPNVIAMFSP